MIIGNMNAEQAYMKSGMDNHAVSILEEYSARTSRARIPPTSNMAMNNASSLCPKSPLLPISNDTPMATINTCSSSNLNKTLGPARRSDHYVFKLRFLARLQVYQQDEIKTRNCPCYLSSPSSKRRPCFLTASQTP